MILGTGISMIAWALFAGQPVIILGGTGPLLIFTESLYQICKSFDIPFLETYVAVGIWTSLFLFLCAIFNLSKYMKHCTRFTDDIFAGLVSLLFIYDAIKLWYKQYQKGEEYLHQATLWALLSVGTLYFVLFFKSWRNTPYFKKGIRKGVANFAPVLSMVVMSFFSWVFDSSDPDKQVLKVNVPPNGFTPSIQDRSWFVDLSDMPAWVWGASIIPALLVAVVIYLEQNITVRIIGSPAKQLSKVAPGQFYHLDLFVLSLLILITSLVLFGNVFLIFIFNFFFFFLSFFFVCCSFVLSLPWSL